MCVRKAFVDDLVWWRVKDFYDQWGGVDGKAKIILCWFVKEIEKHKGNVSFVSISGLKETGKSYLLNKLLKTNEDHKIKFDYNQSKIDNCPRFPINNGEEGNKGET